MMDEPPSQHIDGAPSIHNGIDRVHAAITAFILLFALLSSSLIAGAAGIVSLFLLLAARSDFEAYSITSVGRRERVQNRQALSTGHQCSVCDETAEGGERRHRFTEVVFCGIVIARMNEQNRYYCAEHGSVAVTNGLSKQKSQSLYGHLKVPEDSEFWRSRNE